MKRKQRRDKKKSEERRNPARTNGVRRRRRRRRRTGWTKRCWDYGREWVSSTSNLVANMNRNQRRDKKKKKKRRNMKREETHDILPFWVHRMTARYCDVSEILWLLDFAADCHPSSPLSYLSFCPACSQVLGMILTNGCFCQILVYHFLISYEFHLFVWNWHFWMVLFWILFDGFHGLMKILPIKFP